MLELLRSLGMPDWLLCCASGEINPPEFTFDVPCNLSYGFPPAVLPVWSNSAGPDYIGVLHHWFGDRETTFVRYHTETKRFTEIARTSDQLRIWIVFDFLCNVPDAEEVAEFASATGLCPEDAVEDFFSEYQEDDDIAQHPAFRTSLPLRFVSVGGEYTGDFPLGAVALRRYCEFEVTDEMAAQSSDLPPWFDSVSKPELFTQLLKSNDLEGAWFCLNSSGWKSSEMKPAIQQLASQANIAELELLSNWLYENVPEDSTF